MVKEQQEGESKVPKDFKPSDMSHLNRRVPEGLVMNQYEVLSPQTDSDLALHEKNIAAQEQAQLDILAETKHQPYYTFGNSGVVPDVFKITSSSSNIKEISSLDDLHNMNIYAYNLRLDVDMESQSTSMNSLYLDIKVARKKPLKERFGKKQTHQRDVYTIQVDPKKTAFMNVEEKYDFEQSHLGKLKNTIDEYSTPIPIKRWE